MDTSMTKSELQAQVIELQKELSRITDLKDAAQAERNDRESECQQLIEALAEAKAELHSLSAAYVIQAEALHNANVKIESDAIGYFDDLRRRAEAEKRIAELARENMAQRARIHDLECLESAADETMQMLEAALVEERDANEALYCQVADLQTSVNLASAVTFKLKERLSRAEALATMERESALYWYRKASANANL